MSAARSPSVLTSLLILLTCTTVECSDGRQNTTCISRYHDFEEATITNNSENVDALFNKLHKPNHPLPYSLVIHYQVQLPNGTTQRISSDPNCSSELWMWTYSPVFLLAEPSLFNRFTIYTINYFSAWKSPTVTLTVPLPCKSSTFTFLNRMTMSINDYALRRNEQYYWGYVQRGCGVTVEETEMVPALDSTEKVIEIKYIYINVLTGGVFFQIILICLGTALLLQRWMPVIADYSLHCTKMYSMLWAVLTTAGIFWCVSMTVNTISIITMFKQGHDKIAAASTVAMYIPAVLEFPVAVNFAKKYKFAIPCVYLAPVKLICCGKKSVASLVVRVLSLWVALTAIQQACVNGLFIVIAIAAAPFPVISNTVVIIFTLFCIVHLIAIIITLPQLRKQEYTINEASRKELGTTVLQGITFLFLLVTLVCFVIAGAGFSYIINMQNNQEVILNVGKAILPVALGVTGLTLRRLSNLWWSAYVPVGTENETIQGLGIGRDGYEPV